MACKRLRVAEDHLHRIQGSSTHAATLIDRKDLTSARHTSSVHWSRRLQQNCNRNPAVLPIQYVCGGHSKNAMHTQQARKKGHTALYLSCPTTEMAGCGFLDSPTQEKSAQVLDKLFRAFETREVPSSAMFTPEHDIRHLSSPVSRTLRIHKISCSLSTMSLLPE